MHPPKLGQEIATTGDGRDITRPFLSGLQQPSDYILQRRGGNDLRIYEEVLRDAQVKATWGQRQLAVVSKEWQVDAGGDRRIDKAAAEHLKQQLQNVGWDRITNGMLYGVYYGHAVSNSSTAATTATSPCRRSRCATAAASVTTCRVACAC